MNSITIGRGSCNPFRAYPEGIIEDITGKGIYRIRPQEGWLSFDIIDPNERIFMTCRPVEESIKNRLLRRGEFVFRPLGVGKEIMRIRCAGLFGSRQMVDYQDKIFPIPLIKRSFNFAHAMFSYRISLKQCLKATISKEDLMNEFICISSYLWCQHEWNPD